jgi:hypothetical protein
MPRQRYKMIYLSELIVFTCTGHAPAPSQTRSRASLPTRPAPAGKEYLCHARRRVRRGRAGQMRLDTYGRSTLARQDTAGSDGKAWDGFHSPNQSSADKNPRAPRNSVPRNAAFRVALNMIVVSESSAEATRPARTGRCAPACCCSSAARDDTPQYSDARQISVHTGVLGGAAVLSYVRGPAGPRIRRWSLRGARRTPTNSGPNQVGRSGRPSVRSNAADHRSTSAGVGH